MHGVSIVAAVRLLYVNLRHTENPLHSGAFEAILNLKELSHASQVVSILFRTSIIAVLEGLEDLASNLLGHFGIVMTHFDDHRAELVVRSRLHQILEHFLLGEHSLAVFREREFVQILRQVHHKVE